jgi:hypothetical protein
MEIRILFLILLLLLLWLILTKKGRTYINKMADILSEKYVQDVKNEVVG